MKVETPSSIRSSSVVILILLLFVPSLVLLLAYFFLKNYKTKIVTPLSQEYQFGVAPSSRIPNIIWTYWAEDKLPSPIDLCVESMKIHNPEYNINILSDSTIHIYLPEYFSEDALEDEKMIKLMQPFYETPQRKADFIRIHLLEKFGGIWVDISSITTASYDWVHATQKAADVEYVGYYIHSFTDSKYLHSSPIIENWFMACVPGSKFISEWAKEFKRLSDFISVEEYIKDIKNTKQIDLQNLWNPFYLSMHAAAQTVLQTNQNKFSMHLYVAEKGPFKYLIDNDWDSEKALDELFGNPDHYMKMYPLIKIRGAERRVMTGSQINMFKTYMSKQIEET
jgi:hypothetical protein